MDPKIIKHICYFLLHHININVSTLFKDTHIYDNKTLN